MRIYLSTQFVEVNAKIELISIALIAGEKTFYAESSEFNLANANIWTKREVIPKLKFYARVEEFVEKNDDDTEVYGTLEEIVTQIVYFLSYYEEIEFWSIFSAYEFVALCQLFGGLEHTPNNWPDFIDDLKNLERTLEEEGIFDLVDSLPSELKEDESQVHNALYDCKWNKAYHEYLLKLRKKKIEENNID